jgi:hypothetical protein
MYNLLIMHEIYSCIINRLVTIVVDNDGRYSTSKYSNVYAGGSMHVRMRAGSTSSMYRSILQRGNFGGWR